MTDKLSIYNGALAVIGERKLASLSEGREPRYKLDEIWDRDFLDTILQEGQWNFATRSNRLDFEPSITPAFGYQYAFQKPNDFIRVVGVTTDEFFKLPLLEYIDEAGYWWAAQDQIYVRYVSNDSQYGGDFSLWPLNYTRYVEAELGMKVFPRVGGATVPKDEVKEILKIARSKAKATDAMEEPARFPPPSSWPRARRLRRGDRGSRTSLTG